MNIYTYETWQRLYEARQRLRWILFYMVHYVQLSLIN